MSGQQPASPEAVPAVSMRGITKRFPGVLANDGIDFSTRRGEIHALLGENGAGKSTLSNVLAGLYRPDSGTIHIEGREVVFHSPRDALAAGVGMVHQHFRLVRSFTVSENVVLGQEASGRSPLISPREMADRVAALADRFRLPVRADAKVWQLSVGEQQRVEILKALYREARILILDEPTAVLTPQESSSLFETLRHMADQGRSVIFISHKLNEVMEVADRVTVLLKGRNVRTLATASTSPRELANLMVGRRIDLTRKVARVGTDKGVAQLTLRGVCADDDLGQRAVRDVTLDVMAGEVFGLAGVAGNGQRELVEAISGLRPRDGSVAIGDRPLRGSDPREAIASGLAYVPDDRLGTGLAPGLSIADNLALKGYRSPPMSRGPFLRRWHIRAHAESLLGEYDVRTASPESPVRLLSGGNVQRVMLAREFSGPLKVLVAASPTRGLDIAATQMVRELLLRAAAEGVAVLLVSEDLDEILDLSDRIGVLYEGRIVDVVPGEGADIHEIGLMMAGAGS